MKLRQLAGESGVSTTTLKHWIRVGIMPSGRLRNRTTADYEQRHLDRARLILVLRDVYRASVAEIRSLTDVIDAEDVSVLEVMNACQAFALEVPSEPDGADVAEYQERAFELMRRRDWRGYPGAAVHGLVAALAQAAEVGLDYEVDELMEYADALEPLAGRNVAALGPMGSPDEVARRMLLAVNARARQLVAVSSLAHAAVSIRAAIERGDAPPDLAMPPAAS
ncbi:DNA-binding transcriptional MerR regulator [Microbacterium sp. W4I4]|uniref:MerR family transcriptional regulator n=1 Tax=Microbacterium sp. W4I4 TaxID=3042295 RepID=UPI002786CE39|nr:MerR family transcriptional regulator [Microbacterium sp. W4I4]MDQ0614289.1 DNA-binding transcriptional MerR regulator [Microbacterium sp. W4I4]